MALTKASYSMIKGAPVNVLDFGAVGDGVTDDTAAIQNAIDYATYIGKCACYIPGGRYRITKTLQLGYGLNPISGGNPYSSPHIYGDGATFRGESIFAGTTIIADINNAPAINFQGIRDASLRDLSIIGANYSYALNNRLGNWGLTAAERPTVDDLVLANWIDPALPASASSRFAPLAGISTDAYSGARPATSYPDVTYPSNIFAPTTQWNKVGTSSGITLSNVYITGFYVGLVTYPSGGDGQGEFYQFNDCHFEYNAYGVCITHTQARNFVLTGTRIDNHYAALATGIFGIQNGSAVYQAYGCTFDRDINILALNSANAGPTLLSGCYGESLYKLGDFSTTNSAIQTSLTIDSCEFSFAGQNSRGAPSYLLGGGNGNVSVTNSKFRSFLGLPLFTLKVAKFSNNIFILTDIYGGWCFVRTGFDDKIPPLYSYYPLRAMGIALKQNGVAPYIGDPQILQEFNDVTGVFTGGNVSAGGLTSGYFGRGASVLVSSDTKVVYNAVDTGINNGFNGVPQNIIGRTTYTLSMSGITATITVPALATDDVYNIRGMNPGDMIVWWDGTNTVARIFYIRARTGNVITAELQNGFTVTVNVGGYPTVPTYSGTIDNSCDLYFHCCRYYMPTTLQNITLTAASAVLTVLQTPAGTTVTSDFAVDDSFYAAEFSDYWVNPVSARITNVNGGAKTITITSNALVTQTRRVPVVVKKAPANS